MESDGSPPAQEPARLKLTTPFPGEPGRGLAIIPYRAENLRFIPLCTPPGLNVEWPLGYLHVVVDDTPGRWVEVSDSPLVLQGLTPGTHRVLIELADSTHRVLDSATLSLEIE